MKEVFRSNNFNIIRLLSAMQVVIYHGIEHLGVAHSETSISYLLLTYFPGVPIFFFISGFLISKSYELNPEIKNYSLNRVLRIYPALVVCVLLAVISVYAVGYFDGRNVGLGPLSGWLVAQMTFLQFYNPEFMRDFGTGVMNGSLWTITVELQFYVVTPILYKAFRLAQPNKNATLLFLTGLFLAINVARNSYVDVYGDYVIFKLFSVSFAPWIYMFLIGVLFQKNFEKLHGLLSGKAHMFLLTYIAVAFFFDQIFGLDTGNKIYPVVLFMLILTIFSCAYSFPTWSRKLLRGNDVSYGAYIYHAPVLNMFIYYGCTSQWVYVLWMVVATLVLAVLSWVLVEKPSLKFKKRSFNPLLHEVVKL